jgi:hypothetical protein
MQIQPVAQAAKSWPETAAEDCKAGTRLCDTVKRIRWRLWHGQVARPGVHRRDHGNARRHGRNDVAQGCSRAENWPLLGELETYVCIQSDMIID